MLQTKSFNPVLCLTGHLKKGARLELSLVHRLFNLGNNKNIKRIPVFLCYNRSTTEWKRRDSETKPMTSGRSKMVEEESTNRQAGRWQERSSEQARGRDWCPCKVKEGSRGTGSVRSSCWGKQGRPHRSHGNPNEAQLPPKQSSQPLQPTASRKGRKAHLSPDGHRRFPAEFEDLVLQTCTGHDYRRPLNRQHQIPMLKVGWLHNLNLFKFGLSREESGTNNLLLGSKTSVASEGSSSRRTLLERK